MSQLKTRPTEWKLPSATSVLPAERAALPPGTILQRIYLRKRLRDLEPGRFVHVGTGEGSLSRILLDLGWTGSGWDLNRTALDRARALTAPYIESQRYELRRGDWLHPEPGPPSDRVVPQMLLEHPHGDAAPGYFDPTPA